MNQPPSQRVGRHRLIAKLEQGGMAEVYLALVDDRLGTEALRVVKIMPKSLADDPAFVDMFLDEAKLAMRLGHPNIVQTIEAGRTRDDSLFIAMEWLEGASLFRVVQRARDLAEDLPPPAAVAIALHMLDALQYLHELRDLDGLPLDVVHRDATPSNVFITSAGHVKLLDFGVAKTSVQSAVTVVGVRKGKVGYLAPEILAGRKFDRRSDLYTVGVVLWELLAGRRLWSGASVRRGRAPGLEELGVPQELADACARALSRDPSDRYPTAGAMRDDVEKAAASVGGPMRSTDLAALVHHLLGEDVKHVRRLAANAVRTGRSDVAGERMTRAPEGTSVTVHPLETMDRGRFAVAMLLAAGACTALIAVAVRREPITPAASGPREPQAVEVASYVPPASPAPSTEARIAIRPVPSSAVVFMDGIELAGPPHEALVTADGAQHVLTVSAPGHATREIVVAATGCLEIDAPLTALPAPRAAPGRPSYVAPRPPPSLESESAAKLAPPLRLARPLDTSDPW